MGNNNKFKTILSKMNVEEDGKATSSILADKANSRHRVNKYRTKRTKRPTREHKNSKASFVNRIIGYFNGNESNRQSDYDKESDSLFGIKSRFENSKDLEALKDKLSTTPREKKAGLLKDERPNPRGTRILNLEQNFGTTTRDKAPWQMHSSLEDDIIYKLINKQQQLQQEIDNLRGVCEDLKNEMILLKQENSSNNFVDLSLIKEKRKMNNLHSSDPVLNPEDTTPSSNIKKPSLKSMSFEKLSPIKRQDSTLKKDYNLAEDKRNFDSAINHNKGNAITSSPSKSYRSKNSNLNNLLEEIDDKDEDDDWRLREEDSVSLGDLED